VLGEEEAKTRRKGINYAESSTCWWLITGISAIANRAFESGLHKKLIREYHMTGKRPV